MLLLLMLMLMMMMMMMMMVFLQYTAEADMRDVCFICGINSYKFESRSYVRTV